ncbi:MAG TPA: phosphomannomutase [Candidatus Avacidaminococcus intestinavium]|uniref:Phosphomannomutase n=1 Tax=Candidatus Avacidaminococcus intestinavium TaxID=2840684 RepID=A0A9D1MQT0_9FIRM|nr:phosphomannomutase [Candidatus Avacidaminococcus intestinavium]
MINTNAFKAYDIRGIVPEEVNEDLAYLVGRVFAVMYGAENVVVGRDIRTTGESIVEALSEGLCHGGANVIDIGVCGTEMVYFATAHLKTDGGIMVTASHNPAQYNGMKIVRRGARPVSADTGLLDIKELVKKDALPKGVYLDKIKGSISKADIMEDYIAHLLSYIDLQALKPLTLVANPGNGGANLVLEHLEKHLPFNIVKINAEPDGTFPNGVPNPLLVQNRAVTASAVQKAQADLGIAWDGDFDRCFFFDEEADFIEGYYIVGLLAEIFLQKYPGEKIMYDPRLTWNTLDIIKQYGGEPVRCKSGHAFMKECMRAHDIIYGGEMASHHYFRDFSYCDSGMIPWLLLAEHISKTGKSLVTLVKERMELFPCSGEINRKVEDASVVIKAAEQKYGMLGEVDHLDGLTVDAANWRFNLRMSNTEPVIRLNVETRGDKALLKEKTQELLAFIGGEEA